MIAQCHARADNAGKFYKFRKGPCPEPVLGGNYLMLSYGELRIIPMVGQRRFDKNEQHRHSGLTAIVPSGEDHEKAINP
jgi:hypothetical protein